MSWFRLATCDKGFAKAKSDNIPDVDVVMITN